MRLFPEILHEDNFDFLMFLKWVLILNDQSLERCVLGLDSHDDTYDQRVVRWINTLSNIFFPACRVPVGSHPGHCN